MHEELLGNAEYRLRFADHVQKHFFNGGALTYGAVTNRFLRKASQIDKAIRAYSARWGDAVTEPTLDSPARARRGRWCSVCFHLTGRLLTHQRPAHPDPEHYADRHEHDP